MRTTLTTEPAVLVASPHDESAGQGDTAAVSFLIFAPASSGTALVKPGPVDGPAPDMDDAARWDFGKAMLRYTCEPGVALYGAVAAGALDLDAVEGGERQ